MDDGTTVLTDLHLWDGRQTLDSDSLVLRGGQIESVLTKAELPAPARRRAISLDGASAIPGLIDAHVHMVLDPHKSRPPEPGAVIDPQAMAERAGRMVAAGITTARDLGGGAWRELALRDAITRGEISGPRLICSGQPITCPGGHCHFWGGEADSASAARQVIDRQVSHGVDLIKVMATGGRFTRGSTPLKPQFDLATLTDIVTRAGSHGLKVAAHCHGSEGIEQAVDAGVHSIEHCSWVGPQGWASDYRAEVAQRMALHGTWLSPTINRGWGRMLKGSSQTPHRMSGVLAAMRALEVPLMASTDAGIPGVFHHDLPAALEVFAGIAGLSNEETLLSATRSAAAGLGLAAVTGTLAAGMAADVLIVDGDPITDLTALARPVAVWARGREVLSP